MPISRIQPTQLNSTMTHFNRHHKRRPHDVKTAGVAINRYNVPPVETHPKQLDQIAATEITSAHTKATPSKASRFFSWLANTRLVVLSTSGFLKTVRLFVMSGAPSQTVRNQVDDSLDALTGSTHLRTALHILSDPIANLITGKLNSTDLYAGLNQFFKGEQYSFNQLIDVLLPTIFNNLAKHIHRNVNLASEGEPQPIDLSDIISFLSELIGRHAAIIGQSFDAIDKIEDPEKKERKLQRLFEPVVTEFLSKALPKGVNELPLVIPFMSGKLWKIVNLELGKLFVKTYRIFVEPLKSSKEGFVLRHKGGEALAGLAEIASEKCSDLIPTLFYDEVKSETPEDESVIVPSKISFLASNALFDLLTPPHETKETLKEWLAEEFCFIGYSDQPAMKMLWNFVSGYIDPLLMHIFASLIGEPIPEDQQQGRTLDAIGTITIRLFTVCSRFFNLNGEAIRERIAFLKTNLEPIANDQELLAYFNDFAQDLILLSGLSDPSAYPIPSFLQNILHRAITSNAPKYLLKQYLVFTDTTFEDDDLNRKLRSLLFNPKDLADPSIAVGVIENIHANRELYSRDMFNQFYRELWEKSGTDRIAKIVEALSSVLSRDAITAYKQLYGISDQRALRDETNSSIASMSEWLECLTKRAISEFIAHFLESSHDKASDKDTDHPKSLAPLAIIITLVGIFNKNLNRVAETLEEASKLYSLKSPEYKREAEAAFQKLSQALISYAGFNPLSTLQLPDLPAEDSIKDLLWASVRDNLLPQILQTFYSETVDWKEQMDRSYEKIDDCFHTSHPQWACKVMAQYATDFMKHYLANSSDEAAELMLESLNGYMLNSKSPKGVEFHTLLNEDADSAKTFIMKNIREIPSITDPQFNALWPSLTIYFEALIAKFFAEFAGAIYKIESDNPDFMVDTAIQFLKDAAEHFSIISGKIKETGDENVFNVDIKELVAAFGSKLHDGVPINTEGTEQEKDAERMKGLFIPLADKFLKIAGIAIEEFPLPAPLKKLIGQLAVDKLLPLCLMKAFQKGMEPQVRDQMMFNFVQTLYAALNAIPSQPRIEVLPEADIHPNPKQKHLYDTCGNLVLELVKIIPDTTVQYVFMKEKVKEMSAAAIGDAMMPYLSRWTVIQIIDMMIYSGLPSLHPSKWEGKQGRETLVPRRAFVRPDGKMELKPVKEFKFEFPTEEGEISARQNAEGEELNRVRMQLRDAFTRTISQQLHAKVWAVTKSFWALFQSTLDDFIEGRFGEKGKAFKTKLDVVFRRIFFDVIGSIIAFLSIPMIAALKYINEKTVIDRRSIDVIRNFESNIMENLVYKWVSSIFDSLLRLKEAKETSEDLQLQVET